VALCAIRRSHCLFAAKRTATAILFPTLIFNPTIARASELLGRKAEFYFYDYEEQNSTLTNSALTNFSLT
jgi:hypothetical protein